MKNFFKKIFEYINERRMSKKKIIRELYEDNKALYKLLCGAEYNLGYVQGRYDSVVPPNVFADDELDEINLDDFEDIINMED
jgi:hypothetical protein